MGRAPPAVFETRVLTLERPERHAVERVDVDLDLGVVVVADVGHILLDDLDDAVEVRRVEAVWREEGERGEECCAVVHTTHELLFLQTQA